VTSCLPAWSVTTCRSHIRAFAPSFRCLSGLKSSEIFAALNLAPPATTNDKVEIWRRLRFDILFKGDDWRGTEKASRLERDLAAVGAEIVYVPYTKATSSSALRRVSQNIDAMAAGRMLASNEAPAQTQADGQQLLEGTPAAGARAPSEPNLQKAGGGDLSLGWITTAADRI
jgi:hypothetical protein